MSITSNDSKERQRGKLSKDDEHIILSNLPILSDEEIAELVNRTPEFIKRMRAQSSVIQTNNESSDVIQQLHKKFFWHETTAQLVSSDEVYYFENMWATLYHQFSAQGIVSTDELIMRDFILTDIAINRCLINKRNVMYELDQASEDMDKARELEDPNIKMMEMEKAQGKTNALRGATKALSEEWKVLTEKKDRKYEQLNSTRQLRLEKVEKAGRSFFDLVKMLDAPEYRELEGKYNEFYKIAAEVARQRYEELTEYPDGSKDVPFLTPEAVDKNLEKINE